MKRVRRSARRRRRRSLPGAGTSLPISCGRRDCRPGSGDRLSLPSRRRDLQRGSRRRGRPRARGRGWNAPSSFSRPATNRKRRRRGASHDALAGCAHRRSASIPMRRTSTARTPSAWSATVRDQIARTPSARAIGEIGLDYHYDYSPRDVQQTVFRAQVRLARELKLPVVIHTREADEDTMTVLRDEGKGELHGVLHCFSGTRRPGARRPRPRLLHLAGRHLTFQQARALCARRRGSSRSTAC